MTNRKDYTDGYIEPQTKTDEVMLIAVNLTWKDKPLTLANAIETLRQGRASAPDMWLLTEDDLSALWGALID
jgi:hypothetical protein